MLIYHILQRALMRHEPRCTWDGLSTLELAHAYIAIPHAAQNLEIALMALDVINGSHRYAHTYSGRD